MLEVSNSFYSRCFSYKALAKWGFIEKMFMKSMIKNVSDLTQTIKFPRLFWKPACNFKE